MQEHVPLIIAPTQCASSWLTDIAAGSGCRNIERSCAPLRRTCV